MKEGVEMGEAVTDVLALERCFSVSGLGAVLRAGGIVAAILASLAEWVASLRAGAVIGIVDGAALGPNLWKSLISFFHLDSRSLSRAQHSGWFARLIR